MVLSKERIEYVKRVKQEFQKEVCFTEPYSEYVNGCGITTIRQHDENVPENEMDDLCISVTLRKALPENLALPSVYKGVKVYSIVVGEIRALRKEELE